MTPWINHYDSLLPAESFGSFISYIANRSASAASQINAAIAPVSFAITTNGGNNFSVNTPTATLQGTGWVNVRTIRLEGDSQPLPVTWINDNTWQLTVPVDFGVNSIELQAFDYQGNPVASDSITVTSTESERPLQDFLRVGELMYHPADETPEEIAAGFGDADDFEFIELVNISDTVTLDLSGVQLVAGVTFDFAAASVTMLAPGERLLLVEDAAAFAFRYGAGLNVAGQYAGRFDNAGETLTIVDGNGAVIQSFTYDDNGVDWHPSTDGLGHSLVIINEHGPVSSWSAGASWRPSTNLGGSPGSADSMMDGDVDGNLRVDLADLAIVQSWFGLTSGATRSQGDLNGDGAVNRTDAAIVARNFGRSNLSAAPVPAAIVASSRRRLEDYGVRRTMSAIAATPRRQLERSTVDRVMDDGSHGALSAYRTSIRPRPNAELIRYRLKPVVVE
jgi:hypothetical protein